MIYRLMIFLMLCGIVAADRNCLVGGSSANVNNAGWYNPVQGVAAADAHGGNGAVVAAPAGLSMQAFDVQVQIDTSSANAFDGSLPGHYAYVDFASDYTDGRYEITDVDPTGDVDWIVLSLTHTGPNPAINVCRVGGAVPATYNAVSYDLEDVLDDSIGNAVSQDVVILIYLAARQETTEVIMVDTNGGSGAFWKRLVGVDSSYAELADGSYSTYMDDDDTGAGNGYIFDISVGSIELRHIGAENPAGSAGTPEVTEHCFVSTGQSTVFYACHTERGYNNYRVSTGVGHKIIKSSSLDSLQYAIYLGSHGSMIYGGHYDHGSAFADATVIYTNTAGASIVNVIIEGGTYGFNISSIYGQTVINCTFLSQATAGIYINSANASPLILNCIFDVDDTAATYAILRNNGKYWEDYNITDADTEALSGFTSAYSNSTYNLTFTNTDPLTSISGNNFKPNRGQSIADTYVIDVGFPLWFHASTVSPYSSLGAFPTYDLPAKTSVIAPDTVYGIEGTGSGNGNGGFPATSMLGGLIQE